MFLFLVIFLKQKYMTDRLQFVKKGLMNVKKC